MQQKVQNQVWPFPEGWASGMSHMLVSDIRDQGKEGKGVARASGYDQLESARKRLLKLQPPNAIGSVNKDWVLG